MKNNHCLLLVFFALTRSFAIRIDEYYSQRPIQYISEQIYSNPQRNTSVELPGKLVVADSLQAEVDNFENKYFDFDTLYFDTAKQNVNAIINSKRNRVLIGICSLFNTKPDSTLIDLIKNSRIPYETEGDYTVLLSEAEYFCNILKNEELQDYHRYFILHALGSYVGTFLMMGTDGKKEGVLKEICALKTNAENDQNILVREISRYLTRKVKCGEASKETDAPEGR